jgi:hypothetical protein
MRAGANTGVSTDAPPADPVGERIGKGISDEELTALALAADPDAPLADDAVCLTDVIGPGGPRLLPEWYMPAPMGGAAPLRGWRRHVIGLVIAAFLLITAYGLCNTYDQLHGG